MSIPFRSGFGRAKGPLVIPGCYCWLDFDNTDSITFNGSDINNVKDLSGQGFDFSQATAINQPLWVQDAINGRSTARFNGTSEYFTGLGTFMGHTEDTILYVIKRAPGAIIRGDLFAKYGDNANKNLGLFTQTNNTIRIFYRDLATNVLDANTPSTNDTIIVSSTRQDGRATVEVNNTVVVETGTFVSPNMSGVQLPAIGNAQIFGGGDPGLYYEGDIGECRFWSRVISDNELAAQKVDLANKWGILL